MKPPYSDYYTSNQHAIITVNIGSPIHWNELIYSLNHSCKMRIVNRHELSSELTHDMEYYKNVFASEHKSTDGASYVFINAYDAAVRDENTDEDYFAAYLMSNKNIPRWTITVDSVFGTLTPDEESANEEDTPA